MANHKKKSDGTNLCGTLVGTSTRQWKYVNCLKCIRLRADVKEHKEQKTIKDIDMTKLKTYFQNRRYH